MGLRHPVCDRMYLYAGCMRGVDAKCNCRRMDINLNIHRYILIYTHIHLHTGDTRTTRRCGSRISCVAAVHRYIHLYTYIYTHIYTYIHIPIYIPATHARHDDVGPEYPALQRQLLWFDEPALVVELAAHCSHAIAPSS